MKNSEEEFYEEFLKKSPEEQNKEAKQGCFIGIAILVIESLFLWQMCSDDDKNPPKDNVNTTVIPRPVTGSAEWKEEQIALLKKDSSEIANTDYKSLSLQSNAVMSDAIDYLQLQKIWGGWVEAQKEFYENDKRANIPLKFIRNKATQTLKRVMPSYRKAFANNLGKAVWENDIYVSASGNQNTILNITGGAFAANKNIAEFQNTINRDVLHFGFIEIRYRWYKGAEEYTSYKY